MSVLTEWNGKKEDCKIKYELIIPENDLLIDSVDVSSISSSAFESEYTAEDSDISCTKLNKSEKADRIDYEIAIACGLVAGIIDSLWVGSFDYKRANTWGKDEIEKYVKHVAKAVGCDKTDLEQTIKELEKKAPFVADKYKDDYGGGYYHHIRDFGHHFSIFGLAFSLLTQFTKKCYGTDVNGKLLVIDIEKVHLDNPKIIGRNFHEKVFLGTIQWYLHVVSDMAGSRDYAGKGTGIPGPIVSSMKMMATLPVFQVTDKKGRRISSVMVQKLFDGTLIKVKDDEGKNIRFDLRQEIGLLHETSRQARPVIVNECLVRAMFSVRRLHKEIQSISIKYFEDVALIDFKKILPWNQRALQRMLTVSTGTFEVADLCDAAIRAAIKNKGVKNPGFAKDFALRVNFIGVGRFVIAVKNDGRYIVEDFEKFKEERQEEKAKKNKEDHEFERSISQINAFELTKEQCKILNSLKLQIIKYDTDHTEKEEDVIRKIRWEKAWKKSVVENLSSEVTYRSFSFDTEKEIYDQILLEQEKGNNIFWLYVIALELLSFKPYFPLGSKEDKQYKGLRVTEDYMKTVFSIKQPFISLETLKELERAHKKAYSLITGRNNKTIAGIAGVTALMIVSGGLASVFAPEIAVALVGESFAGLYGAALSNASLALLGGGAIAAGGAGMAGGTVVIAGGASLLSMVGGSGVTTAMALMSTDGYAAFECAKLYTLCRAVLAKRYGATGIIANIASLIDYQIDGLEAEVEKLQKIEINDKQEKERAKRQLKIINKNLKYYRNCSKELNRLVTTYYKQTQKKIDYYETVV